MASTMTNLDGLFERYYGSRVAEALNDVTVEVEIVEDTGVEPKDTTTIDALAERWLASQLNQSLSHGDLKVGSLGFGIEFREFRFFWYGNGLSLLIFISTFATLTLGYEVAHSLILTLLGTQ